MKRGPKQLACISRIIRGWLLSYFFQTRGVSIFAISIRAQSRDPRFSCIDQTTWVDRENPAVFATISYSPPLLSHWANQFKAIAPVDFLSQETIWRSLSKLLLLVTYIPSEKHQHTTAVGTSVNIYIYMFCLYVHIMYCTVNSVLKLFVMVKLRWSDRL